MSKEELLEGKKKRLLKQDALSVVHSDSKKHKTEIASKEKAIPTNEEDEAIQRNPLHDLKSFHASCEFLKLAIKSIKDKKSSKDASTDIASLRTDATIHFVHMKKLNRLAHFRCRKVREATNEAKHKIDQCHLQLQNLLYEAMHLQKEITKCMEFKSKDEEIELVPLDEFYSEAPKSVSNPEETQSNQHLQMLARLEWELEQRKQLAAKLGDTKKSKEKIAEEIQSKQDYLETLQPKLSAILQATRPVQDYLDMPYDAIMEEHQKAKHLPTPLYVLYMQTSAFKEACDKCLKVSIQGDVDAAKLLAVSVFEPDEDTDSDQEENEKLNSKRRRKTSEARATEKKNQVLRKHPLNVILDITDQDGADLQLTFNYLTSLNIITVNVKVTLGPKITCNALSGGELLSPDFVLDELYPGDHGLDSPSMASHFELQRHGLQDLSSYISIVGCPYLWCQWMGGLQFLKKDIDEGDAKEGEVKDPGTCTSKLLGVRAKHSVSAANMQHTISLLRGRMASRISLLHQLMSLERGIIPTSPDSAKLFPAKINSQLSVWRRSTFEDLKVLPHAARFVEAGLVKPSDMVFTAVVYRASAKMTTQVVLTADCPLVAPLFIVEIMWQSLRTALTDVHVMELEEEVNVHYNELLSGNSRDHLLANQLQRLLMCLDVYLETDTPASSNVPIEIPKEKMMPRIARGRARSKPYKYVPELGIFSYRC